MNNEPQPIKQFETGSDTELLLHCDQNGIAAYVGDENGKLRQFFYKNHTLEKKKNLKIGVQVKLNDNAYYKWLFSNYIQISCDLTHPDRRLEFFYGTRKNWFFNRIHYFLNYDKINNDYRGYGNIVKSIKYMIERDLYVEAKVNQYYFEDRPEYHIKHHLHQMLFYGFDDTKKEFLLIGYCDNGLLKKMTLKYSFAKRKDCIKEIYSIEYKPDGNTFSFNINYVLEMIRQYLKSENSSFYLDFIIASPTRIYGIQTYDDLTSEEGLGLLLSDKRILHLICEHKICMQKRIDYLIYKKIICGEDANYFKEKISEIVAETECFKYLVIKCSLSMNPTLVTKMKEKLLEIKEKEVFFLTKLLEVV